MIDYLYYRFYRLWLCSSLAEGAAFMAMLLFSVILSTHVLIVWGILTQYSIVAYHIPVFRLAVLDCRLGNWSINNSMRLLSAYPA